MVTAPRQTLSDYLLSNSVQRKRLSSSTCTAHCSLLIAHCSLFTAHRGSSSPACQYSSHAPDTHILARLLQAVSLVFNVRQPSRFNMAFDSLSTELHLECFGRLEAADILSVCRTSKRYKDIAIGLLYEDIRVTSWNAPRAYKLLQGVEARTDVNRIIKTIEIRHTVQADSWCLPLDQGTNIVMDMLSGILPDLHTHARTCRDPTRL
jgi:hypothetical protein